NLSVKEDCSGLQIRHSYCIEVNYGLGPPATTKSSSTISSTPTTSESSSSTSPSSSTGFMSKCATFYEAKPRAGCYDIAQGYGGTFTLEDFYSWNPAVHNDCSGLVSGYYVCVGVPGTPTSAPTKSSTPTPTGPFPTQFGIFGNCVKYCKAISGNSCYSIAQDLGTFTVEEFRGWNPADPAAQSDCSRLFPDYYYCVAIPGTSTTPTSAVATPSLTPKRPQPQQSGITQICKKYSMVQQGDICYIIEQNNEITAA
ncbi:carbohydrate-binding module family 50 protein, partial [Polychaeton citri CBS 116435]